MRGATLLVAIAALASTAIASPMFIGVGPPVAPTVHMLAAATPGDTTTYDAPATTSLPFYGPDNEAGEAATVSAAPAVSDTTQLNPESVEVITVTATSPWLMTFVMTQTINAAAGRRTAIPEAPVQDFDSGRASIGGLQGRDATCTAEAGEGEGGCGQGPDRSEAGQNGDIGDFIERGLWRGVDAQNSDTITVTQITSGNINSPAAATPTTEQSPAASSGYSVTTVTSYTTILETVTGQFPTASQVQPTSSSSQAPTSSRVKASEVVAAVSSSTQSAPAATSSGGSSRVPAESLPAGPAGVEAIVTDDTTSASDQAAILELHNTLRASWGAGNVSWDSNLADYATAWASRCVMNHTGGPYGENLATGSDDRTAANVFDMWKNEPMSPSDSQSPLLNHKTAVVWKSTSYVGCSMIQCPSMTQYETGGYTNVLPADQSYTSEGTYLVCSYYEPGNVSNEGQIAANVGTCTEGADACGPTDESSGT